MSSIKIMTSTTKNLNTSYLDIYSIYFLRKYAPILSIILKVEQK